MPWKPAWNTDHFELKKFENMDFRNVRSFEICVNVLLYLLCLLIVSFNALIGFGVTFCIYSDIPKMFFYIFWKMSRSMNIFRTNCFCLWCVVMYCDLFPPHPHPRRQSRLPSRGTNIEKIRFKVFFDVFNENKSKNWY